MRMPAPVLYFQASRKFPKSCVEMPRRGKYGRQLGIVVGIEMADAGQGGPEGAASGTGAAVAMTRGSGGAVACQHVGFGVHVSGHWRTARCRAIFLCDLMRDVARGADRSCWVRAAASCRLLLWRGQVGVEHQARRVAGTEERPGCRPRRRGAKRRPHRHCLELRTRQTHHDATAIWHGHLLHPGSLRLNVSLWWPFGKRRGLTCCEQRGSGSAVRQRFCARSKAASAARRKARKVRRRCWKMHAKHADGPEPGMVVHGADRSTASKAHRCVAWRQEPMHQNGPARWAAEQPAGRITTAGGAAQKRQAGKQENGAADARKFTLISACICMHPVHM